MCGLVGMLGNFTEQDKKAFRNLLRFDVIRGEHSTGVAVVEKGTENIRVYKKVGAPDMLFNAESDFSDNGIYEGPTKDFKPKLFIGHNRYATKGKITDENAHPFHHNSVVGAHNGTLDSVYHLEDGHKFDVDSEAIFYNLDKYDKIDTIGNIEGAYALTWYDANENKLFVIRNKERPLHYTRRKDSDVIYWASVPWMLELALAYANISHGDIHEFDEDTLYSFDMDAVDDGKMREEKWLVRRSVKGRPSSWKQYYYGGGYYGNDDWKSGGTTKSSTSTAATTAATNTGGGSNVHPFKGTGSSTPSSQSSQAAVSKDLTKEELVQWGAWEGKEIEFVFQGAKKGMSGIEYLSAYPANPVLDLNIRVFAAGKPQWDDWNTNLHRRTFTGKVKKFVRYVTRGKKENYLAIDLRTIREKPEPNDKEGQSGRSNLNDRFYTGFNGNYLSHSEWEKCTRFGCEVCSRDADEDDDDLLFLGDESFVCGECSQLDVFKCNTMAFAN